MERNFTLIFKKYGVFLNILLVFLLSYTLAGLIGRGVAGIVTSKIKVPAVHIRVSSRKVVHHISERVNRDSYRVIMDKNIFGVKVSDEAPETQEEVVTETPLKLKLLGVIVSTDPEKSMAIIKDQNSNKTDIYFIHDKIQGAEILEIKKASVILKRAGKKEVLYLYENLANSGNSFSGRSGIVSRYQGFRPPIGGGGGGGVNLEVREVANNTYEVDKNDFDRITNNLGSILTQARVVPYFRNGKIVGYKIFNIRPDGVFAKIGLRNVDIIKSVNGETLESPEKALQLFQFLKTEDTFRIVLERNGRQMTLTYRLR